MGSSRVCKNPAASRAGETKQFGSKLGSRRHERNVLKHLAQVTDGRAGSKRPTSYLVDTLFSKNVAWANKNLHIFQSQHFGPVPNFVNTVLRSTRLGRRERITDCACKSRIESFGPPKLHTVPRNFMTSGGDTLLVMLLPKS